jgi:hypothetical protein
MPITPEGVPRALSGQIQPGAFLLGKFRSGGHPLLWAERPAPPRRHPAPGRPHLTGRPIRTSSVPAASGRARLDDTSGRHSMPTPTLSRRASARRRSGPTRRSIIPSSGSSCSPMTRCNGQETRPTSSASFCKAPTEPPRIWAAGTAPGWSAERRTGSSATVVCLPGPCYSCRNTDILDYRERLIAAGVRRVAGKFAAWSISSSSSSTG